MNNKKKTVLWTIGFLAIIILAYVGYTILSKNYRPQKISVTQSTSQQESKATPAPDFTVYDANGNKVKLSDFKGKPVVLNFWASWCPPCKGELPDFNEVYKDVKNDVNFLMVDLVDGQRETQAKGEEYMKSMGYSLPTYFDLDMNAASVYQIYSIPTTYFIDAKGNILTSYEGAIDKQTLLDGINLIKKG